MIRNTIRLWRHLIRVLIRVRSRPPRILGSTTTDRDKLTTNQLTTNNADELRRAILNIFLLSPEPSCPNPHFVTKSVTKTCNKIIALRSVCLRSVCRGLLTWLANSRRYLILLVQFWKMMTFETNGLCFLLQNRAAFCLICILLQMQCGMLRSIGGQVNAKC